MPRKRTEADGADQLESLVSRIVRIEEEKRGLSGDIRDLYIEAKGKGLNVKAIKLVVKHALEDDEKRTAREETETEADMMKTRLGDLFGTPLADAVMPRAARSGAGAEAH
jgi:uncharacterized protein (UPF0335 family)